MNTRAFRAFVFAAAPGAGNEARVVVHEPDALRDAEMQRIAAQLGAPVCAFVEHGAARKTRFFTVARELPYCGHGVLAAGAAAMRLDGDAPKARLECGSGPVDLRREAEVITARTRFTPQLRDESADVVRKLEAALGVDEATRTGEPVCVGSIGSPKWLVPVRDRSSLYAIRPDASRLADLSGRAGINGAYVYCFDTVSRDAHAHARSFNPLSGSAEDKATGVAAGALAWRLRTDRAGGGSRFRVEQGLALGALNEIQVVVDEPDVTEIGGVVRLVELATSGGLSLCPSATNSLLCRPRASRTRWIRSG
ncbi:MAG: PhzF family phenazine biosynthesis protein [Polyangiaceae bacterium]|nr:PhzF family phenazine biosynthesis protein [Polyangiaceae bacterium]